MSHLLHLALRRARRREGPHPEGTRREALVLWSAFTEASPDSWASFFARRAPTAGRLADGAVALARQQAERHIRTIGGKGDISKLLTKLDASGGGP